MSEEVIRSGIRDMMENLAFWLDSEERNSDGSRKMLFLRINGTCFTITLKEEGD